MIKAGIDLFSRQGFSDTTVEEITRRAGVAKGTFYLYFSDKKQFFGEIVKTMADQQERNYQRLMSIPDPRERLQAYIASELDFYRDNADFARFTITAVSPDAESFINWYVEVQKKHINYLAKIVSYGCAAGAFNVKDVYRSAQFLQGAVFMFVAQEILSPSEASGVEESARFILHTFLEGAVGKGKAE